MRREPAAREPRPGDVVDGKYRIERALGRGGMGAVFAARHEQLGHRVALKLPAHAAAPGATDRFLREARAAAVIESEHVVRVFDAGERAPGEPYLVMELLTGDDLAAILAERGPLDPEQAVTWILQAGIGLAAAHARGIVHRDLKPANLFLARRADGTSILKVLDFGISKLRPAAVADDDDGDAALTQTGQILGSPRYMSPEQMAGSPDVDERADIWALGAILHELLCGAPAFAGRSFGELRRRVLSEPPRSVRLDRPEIHVDLEAVILRCLDRAPARRFADVPELLDALVPFGPPGAASYAARARSELAHRPADRAGATAPPSAGTVTEVDEAAGSGAAPQAPASEDAPAGPTVTSPPVSRTGSIQSSSRPPVQAGATPSAARRWSSRVAVGVAFAALLGAAGARWWPGASSGASGAGGPATSPGSSGVSEDAELLRAAQARVADDRAEGKRALQALVDRALSGGVAPGSPRAAIAATAVLALADLAAEEITAPPPARSLETYLEPADDLARRTHEGMGRYGAVIAWQDAAAVQCAVTGQARLHERQAELLFALPAPPPRSGPHERGAWSPEAALDAYRTAAEGALDMALDLYENAVSRPVPSGGCREEAARGRARLREKLGR